MSVDLGTAYVQIQASARGIGKQIAREMAPVVPAIADEGKEAGNKFSDNFKDKMKTGMKVAGAVGGAIAVKGFVDAMGKESDNDLLASRLGLDPKESKRIGKISGGLYSQAYGENLGEVNNALDGIQSNIGDLGTFSNKELEGMGKSALNLSKTMDVDVGDATRGVGQLMRNGMAKDATDAFDMITAASQKVPASMRGELLETIEEYGGDLSSLGLKGPQAFGMLSAAVKAGARNTDIAADALRELSIRGIDGSKTTAEGFALLGLSADDYSKKLAAGGPAAAQATSEIIQALGGMSDPIAQEAAGVALFGTKYEEMGLKAITAMDPATAALQDYKGAAKEAGDTLNDNTSNRVEEFKRKAADMASSLAAKAIPHLEKLGRGFAGLPAPVQGAIAGIGGLAVVAGPLNNAAEGAKGLYDKLGLLKNSTAGTALKDAAKHAGTFATNTAKTVGNGAAAAIRGVAGATKAAGAAAFTGAKNMGLWVFQTAKSVGTAIASTAATVAQKAAMVAGNVVTAISTGLQAAFNFVMSLNPVMLIVLAIVALIGILVLAYNKVDWFKNFVDGAFRLIGNVVGWVVDFIKNNWRTVFTILTIPIRTAVAIIKAVFRGISIVFRVVKNFIMGAVRAIANFFRTRFAAIAAVARAIGAKVKAVWNGIKIAIQNVVKRIVAVVVGIKNRVTGSLRRVFDALKNGVRAARDFVSRIVNKIVDKIKGIGSRIGGIASSLASPFKSAFRAIARFWNNTAGKLRFTVPSWVPKFGGRGFSMPKLPTYHTGGVVEGRPGTEVPIMALAGERVLNRQETVAYDNSSRPRGGPSGGDSGDVYRALRGAKVVLDVSAAGMSGAIRRAELVRR